MDASCGASAAPGRASRRAAAQTCLTARCARNRCATVDTMAPAAKAATPVGARRAMTATAAAAATAPRGGGARRFVNAAAASVRPAAARAFEASVSESLAFSRAPRPPSHTLLRPFFGVRRPRARRANSTPDAKSVTPSLRDDGVRTNDGCACTALTTASTEQRWTSSPRTCRATLRTASHVSGGAISKTTASGAMARKRSSPSSAPRQASPCTR